MDAGSRRAANRGESGTGRGDRLPEGPGARAEEEARARGAEARGMEQGGDERERHTQGGATAEMQRHEEWSRMMVRRRRRGRRNGGGVQSQLAGDELKRKTQGE